MKGASTSPNTIVSAFLNSVQQALERLTAYTFYVDGVEKIGDLKDAADILGSAVLETGDGQNKGFFLIALSIEASRLLVAGMLDRDEDEVDNDLLDGIEEFVNVVVGGAANVLDQGEFQFDFELPIAGEPEDVDVALPEGLGGVRICCRMGPDPFEIMVWLPYIQTGLA